MNTHRLLLYVLAFLVLATAIPSYFLYRVLATGREYVLEKNVEDLSSTDITPHLEAPVDKGRNLIWCATFQLVWNEACDRFGYPVRLEGDPPGVAELNLRRVDRRHVHEESCLLVSGTTGDNVRSRIIEEAARKFGGAVSPRLLPPEECRPDMLVMYCLLYRRLAFPVPFEDLVEPVVFGGEAVRNFGVNNTCEREHEPMYSQVLVHDYKGPDDFVIEMKTRSDADRLVLAKMPDPGATLADTVALAAKRLVGEPEAMNRADVLRVPRIDFDLAKRFGEMIGRRVLLDGATTDFRVFEAAQGVRFSLDEEGVELRSEAQLSFGCGARGPGVRRLVFDKPFLLFIGKAGEDMPYFAMWVGHPEILEPVR